MSEYNKLQTYILKKHSRNFHQITALALFPNKKAITASVQSDGLRQWVNLYKTQCLYITGNLFVYLLLPILTDLTVT